MLLDTNAPPPKLQPPGAGLPFIQSLYVRLWLGMVVSRLTPSAEARRTYEGLTQKLIERISAVPADTRRVKVLADPIPGLEDSSRYWSLNELMEHLLIVSRAVEQNILKLASGTVPEGKADTAKVKPGKADHDLLNEFTEYAPGLMARLDEKLAQPGMDFNSRLTYRHPWMGPLTARQWYWMLSSHQGVHYRQAKDILSGLKA